VGVTPSAWGSNYKAIESAGNAAAMFAGANINGVQLSSNCYNDNTNWIYKTNGTAARFSVNNNQFQWNIAPSGIAGNNISGVNAFTQAMTLDGNGNLGLGVAPKTWSNGLAFEVSSLLKIASSSVFGAAIANNAYYNSGWKYSTASTANLYQTISGEHRWSNALSGTNPNDPIAFTQAMTLDASGNLLVGVTSANANGGVLQLKSGITFPATQVASSDANTLDDYEEGTFTPTIVGSTSAGTGTYTTNTGKYTKIGNVVTFQVYINWTTHTGTGNMRIGNLPFTNGNAFWAGSFGFIANIALTAGCVLTGYVEASSSYVTLSQTPVGGGVASDVPIDTAGTIVFSASYTV